tara:strand:- start:3147 stop:4244 length:1098 start_codon:yes stop_codon:yes gene_type:complete
MAAKFGSNTGGAPPILPVYFKQSEVIETGFLSVYEVCKAAEKEIGTNLIDGAQLIRGLWRIYFSERSVITNRIQLLARGIHLRGHHVGVCDRNPYLTRNNNEATKLMIGGIPLSVSNEQILSDLSATCRKNNSTIIGQIKNELARDENGKLTRFKTGRRFVYIDPPTNPLPKQLPLAGFTASIRYKEQNVKPTKCNICNQSGHTPNQCTLCFDCFTEGHKRGDPCCTYLDDQQAIEQQATSTTLNQHVEDQVAEVQSPVHSAESNPITDTDSQHEDAKIDHQELRSEADQECSNSKTQRDRGEKDDISTDIAGTTTRSKTRGRARTASNNKPNKKAAKRSSKKRHRHHSNASYDYETESSEFEFK